MFSLLSLRMIKHSVKSVWKCILMDMLPSAISMLFQIYNKFHKNSPTLFLFLLQCLSHEYIDFCANFCSCHNFSMQISFSKFSTLNVLTEYMDMLHNLTFISSKGKAISGLIHAFQ